MQKLLERMEQTVFGQRENVRLLIVALLAGGHVLLEGVPGLGKTKMVRTLAALVDGSFRRLQFTPDMMPSDITGTVVFNMKNNEFETVQGPVFTNLLLADEINRTPPRTQAALLEAMEERQVTIQGNTYRLPSPFFVVATQNPIEYEGTYPLPEAQLDRFLFKLIIDYPPVEAEKEILRNHVPFNDVHKEMSPDEPPAMTLEELLQWQARLKEVVVGDALYDYVASLLQRTREDRRLLLGASPRAGIALVTASRALALLEGREFVTPDDIKTLAGPVLRHRLIVQPQAELEGETSERIIRETLASVPVPR